MCGSSQILTGQDVSLRSRMRRATAISATDATARKGWKGANQVTAPEAPSATSTSLFHTGHPTAKKVTNVPAIPSLVGASISSFEGVPAEAAPVRT